MDDNVENCCRICLDVESRHVSILDDSIILHIKSCLPLNISANDDLPKLICESCVSQLNEFYNFQLNARCSQDWLESSIQEKSKKCVESKTQVQPLPDSEYNSDSLLEFLNNTENIEEYLNNLGKEDIPSIVNMLDQSVGTEATKFTNGKTITQSSPKKKESPKKIQAPKADIAALDSDIKVKEVMKKPKPRYEMKITEKLSCFACKTKFDTIQMLSQHLSICDRALRTCVYCNILFDSKQKMTEHTMTHSAITSLKCGKRFDTKDKLLQHCKKCVFDHIASMGFVYSCKQCNATFNERFQLYKHAKEHVRKAEERVCDICGHMFVGVDALANHRKVVHEKLENTVYRCKVCSFTSPDRRKIFCHVQKHTQAKAPIRHLCESCGQSFANQSALTNHAFQHATKRHKCHIDQKRTDVKLKKNNLLEHTETIMCEKCGEYVNSYESADHVCL